MVFMFNASLRKHVPRTTHYAPILVHLDMNSYFASVEQQANPFLRGRPLGVCAYLHPGGCVIAASIEAKERGMKVGMRMKDAKKLIPDAVFVQNEPAKYRSTTSRIFSILHEVTDRVEHYSIDEAFMDVTGWVRDEAEAAWMMTRIRQRIYREVGEWLRCSIGIAPTRFYAKLGSDIQKPSGLTIITSENVDSVLANLELDDLYGVGRRMKRRIELLGYQAPLDLKRAPVANLIQAFGKMGYLLWAKLNMIDAEVMHANDAPPKSIGHSFCVPRQANTDGKILPILTKLAERAARRLRKKGLFARLVIVSIGFRNEEKGSFYWGSHYESLRLEEVTADSFTLIDTAVRLLHRLWDGREIVSFLAVTYTEFGTPSGQMTLLRRYVVASLRRNDRDAYATTQQRNHIDRLLHVSKALDAIKDRYGAESIVIGRQFGATIDDAPDRIGFRKVDGV